MERKWDSMITLSPFYDTLPAMARKEDATLWNARTEGGNDSEFRQTSGAHGSAGRTDRLPRGQPLAFGGTRPFCHECKGCSFHGFFAGFDARRFPKGERKALWCARRRIPMPRVGIDAPTTARIGTGRPKGRSHFSFDGERKVCKRKPAARHSGKKPLIAHFDGGSRNVARNGVR